MAPSRSPQGPKWKEICHVTASRDHSFPCEPRVHGSGPPHLNLSRQWLHRPKSNCPRIFRRASAYASAVAVVLVRVGLRPCIHGLECGCSRSLAFSRSRPCIAGSVMASECSASSAQIRHWGGPFLAAHQTETLLLSYHQIRHSPV